VSALPRNYIHRAAWGAKPPLSRPTVLLASRVDTIVYHYTAANADEQADHKNCAQRVRGVQAFHQNVRGWNDIAYCVDAETEALTTGGWKRYDQLQEGDLIVTISPETGEAEWQPVEHVNIFSSAHRELVSIEAKGHSSLTTPNHRWLVERSRFRTGTVRMKDEMGRWAATGGRTASKLALRERMFVTSETLTCWDRITTAAPVANVPVTPLYSDEFVELVAWAWTEGHVHRSRGKLTPGITIYQSHVANPHLVKRIASCLTKLYGAPLESLRKPAVSPRWRVSRNGHKTEFRLNHVAGRQVLTVMSAPDKVVAASFITALTKSQLQRFVEVSVLADGSTTGPTSTVAQAVEARLEPLQIAATLLGLRTFRFEDEIRGRKRHGLRISRSERSRSFWPHHAKPRRVEHTGIVWCPTTPNGTWLARRHGTVYFTGNSYLTCKHGYIYEGRGIENKSAATGVENSHTLAVCFLGDDTLDRDDITAQGRAALVEITRWIRQRRPSVKGYAGHRDYMATSCPGNELYTYIHGKTFAAQVAVDEKARLRKTILGWRAEGWGWDRIKATSVWQRFRALGGK
jgi:hypothetical protein